MNSTETGLERRHHRGVIASWQFSAVHGFHGYVRPDKTGPDGQLILINTHSLRNPSVELKVGDNVLFATERTPRGELATDVYVIFSDLPETAEAEGRFVGTVRDLHSDRGFGILELDDGRTAMFHFSDLENPSNPPSVGALVSMRLFERQTINRDGLRETRLGATDLEVYKSFQLERPIEVQTTPDAALHKQALGILAKALLAR